MLTPRQLWSLLTPLTVLVCAYFAARTANNVLARDTLGDEAAARQPAPLPAVPQKSKSHPKGGSALVATNMFCSACQPSAPAAARGGPRQRTDLPLRLIATNISSVEAYSFAAVVNTESQRQGSYQLGEEIPNAGIVMDIGLNYLEFARTLDQVIERIDFQSGAPALASRPAAQASASASAATLVESYIRIIDETHFEIDRELVKELQGNARLAGALARPILKDGHMAGVRLYGVRSGGLAQSMGLRNGDTVMAANGVKLESLEAALELMGQIQQKDHWNIDIERSGKALQLQIDLH